MRVKIKKNAARAAALAMAGLLPTMPVSAEWKEGTGDNISKWYYTDAAGTKMTGWQWIDGNNDGVAECYYFGTDGWMAADTTTNDGYAVDTDGKWTVDGVAQTKLTEGWRQDAENKWYYIDSDGAKVTGTWKWIDGNGDGIAECYCFDSGGRLITNTTTQDGYTVNENGAWIENGVAQTKMVKASASSSGHVSSGGSSRRSSSGSSSRSSSSSSTESSGDSVNSTAYNDNTNDGDNITDYGSAVEGPVETESNNDNSEEENAETRQEKDIGTSSDESPDQVSDNNDAASENTEIDTVEESENSSDEETDNTDDIIEENDDALLLYLEADSSNLVSTLQEAEEYFMNILLELIKNGEISEDGTVYVVYDSDYFGLADGLMAGSSDTEAEITDDNGNVYSLTYYYNSVADLPYYTDGTNEYNIVAYEYELTSITVTEIYEEYTVYDLPGGTYYIDSIDTLEAQIKAFVEQYAEEEDDSLSFLVLHTNGTGFITDETKLSWTTDNTCYTVSYYEVDYDKTYEIDGEDWYFGGCLITVDSIAYLIEDTYEEETITIGGKIPGGTYYIDSINTLEEQIKDFVKQHAEGEGDTLSFTVVHLEDVDFITDKTELSWKSDDTIYTVTYYEVDYEKVFEIDDENWYYGACRITVDELGAETLLTPII